MTEIDKTPQPAHCPDVGRLVVNLRRAPYVIGPPYNEDPFKTMFSEMLDAGLALAAEDWPALDGWTPKHPFLKPFADPAKPQ